MRQRSKITDKRQEGRGSGSETGALIAKDKKEETERDKVSIETFHSRVKV